MARRRRKGPPGGTPPNPARRRAKREAATGGHRVFQDKKGMWVCICGAIYAETESEATFHIENPHMTTEPEDWNPLDTQESKK